MKFIYILILVLIFSPENYYFQNKSNNSITIIDTVIINSSNKVKVISKFDTLFRENTDIYDLVTTIEIRQMKSNNLLQTICDTSDSFDFPTLNYIDINVDKYVDIEFKDYEYHDNYISVFWLYDSSRNKFLYSKEFSGLENYTLYPGSKIIDTFISSGMMPSGSFSSWKSSYKIQDNKLIEIESEGSYRNSDGTLTTSKSTLINDSLMVIKLDSLIYVNNSYVKKYYNFIQDTLLLTETIWAETNKEKLTESYNPKIYFETEQTGTLKYTKKEVYNYSVNKHGKLEKNIKTHIVSNNKWQLVK